MWHAWERRENCTRVWWESPKERDHSEDRGILIWVDGIRTDLGEIGGGGIHLAQDRDRWLALVNTVMNLRVLVPRRNWLLMQWESGPAWIFKGPAHYVYVSRCGFMILVSFTTNHTRTDTKQCCTLSRKTYVLA
jgi:hypothetical protein